MGSNAAEGWPDNIKNAASGRRWIYRGGAPGAIAEVGEALVGALDPCRVFLFRQGLPCFGGRLLQNEFDQVLVFEEGRRRLVAFTGHDF